jgi:hypothetical protein
MYSVIVYAAIRNVFAAAARPLWFDEIATMYLSSQPRLSDIWIALEHGADGQPPAYYLLERIAGHLAHDVEIAYRLPSILAFCCVLWCMFVFLRRHNGEVSAFLCSTALLLTPLNEYSIEARPYEVVAVCIAFALVCYQRAGRLRWVALFGCSLVIAQSMHYYAFFFFAPFGLAELVVALRTWRVRWSIWIALAVGFVPLAVFWPLTQEIKRVYGAHIQGVPSLRAAGNFYTHFLYGDFLLIYHLHFPYAGFVAAIAISLLAILMIIVPILDGQKSHAGDSLFYDNLLGVGLLAVPILGLVVTKIGHGQYMGRYSLATLLCIPVMGAFVLRFQFLRRHRTLYLVLLLGFLAGVVREQVSFWYRGRGHFAHVVNPAEPISDLVKRAGRPDLPLVASEGFDCVQLAYYAPPQLAKRLLTVVDPQQAVVYAGSDTVDIDLAIFAQYGPLRVYPFSEFRQDHPEFLLYSDGTYNLDWWPRRLADDGYSLQVLAAEGMRKVYLVNAPGR